MAFTYDTLYMKSPDYRGFTAFAWGETVSGGDLLSASGADNVLASGVIQDYDVRVVRGTTIDDQYNCVGVALQTTAASGAVTVITQGFLVLPGGSDTTRNGVTPGYKVAPDANFAGVIDCWAVSGTTAIGRAFTGAGAVPGSPVLVWLSV